jgi:hypothetical protein
MDNLKDRLEKLRIIFLVKYLQMTSFSSVGILNILWNFFVAFLNFSVSKSRIIFLLFDHF